MYLPIIGIYLILILLSSFFCNSLVGSHSIIGFVQNFSLIPISNRVIFFLLLFLIIVIPFFIFKKKDVAKLIRSSIYCLGFIIMINVFVDCYYVYSLVKMSNSLKMAKVLIKTRYGMKEDIIKLLNKGININESQSLSAINSKYSLRFNSDIFRLEFLSTSDNQLIFTMKHWVMHPGEVHWILGETLTDSDYILYWHAHDASDLSKVYVANLKTKQIALLTKGTWLNDLAIHS